LTLDDGTLGGLIAATIQHKLERQHRLDANIPVDHPSVIEINGQIETLRESIRENLRNIKSSLKLLLPVFAKEAMKMKLS
jgi:hypothetical protein